MEQVECLEMEEPTLELLSHQHQQALRRTQMWIRLCAARQKTHSTIALKLYALDRPAVEMSDNRRPGSVTANDLSTNPLGLPVSRLSVQARSYIQGSTVHTIRTAHRPADGRRVSSGFVSAQGNAKQWATEHWKATANKLLHSSAHQRTYANRIASQEVPYFGAKGS